MHRAGWEGRHRETAQPPRGQRGRTRPSAGGQTTRTGALASSSGRASPLFAFDDIFRAVCHTSPISLGRASGQHRGQGRGDQEDFHDVSGCAEGRGDHAEVTSAAFARLEKVNFTDYLLEPWDLRCRLRVLAMRVQTKVSAMAEQGNKPMPSRQIVVKIARDPEADVWFVESSSLPGLSAEADTADALMRRIPALIADLIDENGFDDDDDNSPADMPLEITASYATSVRVHEAA